jgi:hypothetical protein
MIDSKTNYNAVGLAAAVTFSLLGIFLASGFIFTSDNPFTKAAMLIGGLLLVVGTIQPRRMLYVMVPITFYLDEVKRLLVVIGRTGIDDVTAVLAIAPLASIGILIGCVIQRIFFRKRGGLVERMVIFSACTAFVAFGGMEAFTAGSLVYGLKTVANSTVYFLLPWAVLQCFTTREQVERFLKFCVFTGVPVALYGIWQFFMGLSDFEITYLKSGLTIIADPTFNDVRPRPFSTLSSPHAYSSVMAFMFVLSYRLGAPGGARSLWSAVSRFFFALFIRIIPFGEAGRRNWIEMFIARIYLVALLLSMTRGATLAGFAMIVAARLFRSKTGTGVVYLLCTVTLAGLVLFAEPILNSLDKLQSYLPMGSGWQEQAFRLGTISDRLKGYQNIITNPGAWPLVANPLKYRTDELVYGDTNYSHDLVSQMILRLGIIPVILCVLAAIYLLSRAHSAILRLLGTRGGIRPLAAQIMSMLVIFLLSQSGGAGMTVFPMNFWIGIFTGLLAVICVRLGDAVPAESARKGLRLTAPALAGGR